MGIDVFQSQGKRERDVLIAVSALSGDSEEPPNGSEVRKWIGDKSGNAPYSQSLYGAIATLDEEGLIDKVAINERSNGLVLTDDGRDAVVELQRIIANVEH